MAIETLQEIYIFANEVSVSFENVYFGVAEHAVANAELSDQSRRLHELMNRFYLKNKS